MTICAELMGIGVGLRFQPTGHASPLYFATVRCTFAGQKAAMLGGLRTHAIQACEYCDPPLHRQPYPVADLQLASGKSPVTKDIGSQIVAPPAHADTAHGGGMARVGAAVQQGSPL